jgi:2-oxo-4-hydroxy-4-carboxy--5-ureidoimidazoline (OHCU) decarboxylase
MNRLKPDGFWPKTMSEGEKAASVSQFERDIFTIWKSIEEKDWENECHFTQEEVNAPGQVLFECATMHRQDRAIKARGFLPNMVTIEKEMMAELRRKAARAGM